MAKRPREDDPSQVRVVEELCRSVKRLQTQHQGFQEDRSGGPLLPVHLDFSGAAAAKGEEPSAAPGQHEHAWAQPDAQAGHQQEQRQQGQEGQQPASVDGVSYEETNLLLRELHFLRLQRLGQPPPPS